MLHGVVVDRRSTCEESVCCPHTIHQIIHLAWYTGGGGAGRGGSQFLRVALSSRSSKVPTRNTFARFLRIRDEHGTWPSFIIVFIFVVVFVVVVFVVAFL